MIDRDPLPHDPGGKVRLPLQDGVIGDAEFSPCGRYRLWLSRSWPDEPGQWPGFALWIGMNPSTAESNVDDPTIRREIAFTKAMGIGGYVKCNIMDYRATNPKSLLTVIPRSDKNLRCIFDHAQVAKRVIVAWGALPKPLRHYADDVISVMRGHQLFCMGKTRNGSPRHPLYLPNNAECVPWP